MSKFKNKLQKFLNGKASIKVLKEDMINGVVLLEKAEPGKRLRDIPERQQISIASQVIKKLHRPIIKDLAISFPTISDWGKAFGRYKKRFLKAHGPVPKWMFDKAITITMR